MLNAAMSDVREMKAPRLFRRILSSAPATSTLPSRTSIRPPAVWGQAEPVWKALWSWLQTPSGTDDLPAWQRLVANLPFQDPRRSLAASRIGQLRARAAETPGDSTM